jgi:hypothetical protein
MKTLTWYLAWIISIVAGILILLAIISSLSGIEILKIKWMTYWWASENFILMGILVILLYSQLKKRSE